MLFSVETQKAGTFILRGAEEGATEVCRKVVDAFPAETNIEKKKRNW